MLKEQCIHIAFIYLYADARHPIFTPRPVQVKHLIVIDDH